MAYVVVLLELLQKNIFPIPTITTKHDIVNMNHHAAMTVLCHAWLLNTPMHVQVLVEKIPKTPVPHVCS